MAVTIQSNIKTNTKDFRNFSYFLGGIDATRQNLESGDFTPYIQGISRIWVYKPPVFMDKLYPELTQRWMNYVETGYTRIDGIADVTVEFTDFEGGFNGQKISNVNSARDDTDTISIAVYEQSGQPMKEFLETWVSGARDLKSGVAHYHGEIRKHHDNNLDGVAYGQAAHTCEFVYCTMDPTALDIEYGAMFANCFPTKVSKAHLNFEAGNRDRAQIDMEFRTIKYESPSINELCSWYLAKSTVPYNYLNFDPKKGVKIDDINGHPIAMNSFTEYQTGDSN